MARTPRYCFSFTLNESTEKDMINILDSFEGKITIAQFIKVAICFFNQEMESLMDSEEIYDEKERQKERIELVLGELEAYKDSHK